MKVRTGQRLERLKTETHREKKNTDLQENIRPLRGGRGNRVKRGSNANRKTLQLGEREGEGKVNTQQKREKGEEDTHIDALLNEELGAVFAFLLVQLVGGAAALASLAALFEHLVDDGGRTWRREEGGG